MSSLLLHAGVGKLVLAAADFNSTNPELELDVDPPYGYVPTKWITLIFLAWFGVSGLVHLFQAVLGRTWYMIFTCVLAAIGESIAWSGRLWSSISPFADTPFMMQISSAILAPTPLLAANFIITGIIITQLGPSYSRLRPRLYSAIFLTCDIIALVVQGVGGGLASSADDPRPGANIMLGGIVFQTIVIFVYSLCSAEFLFRYLKDRPLAPRASVPSGRGMMYTKMKFMIGAMFFSTLLLFIRAIYRIIELAGGWDGPVITTEVYFNVFDGVMVGLAMTALNVLHPGFLLHPIRDIIKPENLEMRGRKNVTLSGESMDSVAV